MATKIIQILAEDILVNGFPWCLRRLRICLLFGWPGFDPWVGKIPWRRTWQLITIFLLENPTERGAQQATVHGVTKSQTWLSTYWLNEWLSTYCEMSGITLGPPSLNPLELQILHHSLPWLTSCFYSFMNCIVVLTYSLTQKWTISEVHIWSFPLLQLYSLHEGFKLLRMSVPIITLRSWGSNNVSLVTILFNTLSLHASTQIRSLYVLQFLGININYDPISCSPQISGHLCSCGLQSPK